MGDHTADRLSARFRALMVGAFESKGGRSAVLDPARLTAVRLTRLLDTGPDEAFDRLSRLAAMLLNVPFAFVTVVDESRSFWKSCVGVTSLDLAARQNRVEESFCQYVVETDAPLIVEDTRLNDLTKMNPSIESMNVTAWAGYPLRSIDGLVLGTFCVVDTIARDWTAEQVEVLGALAAAVESEIRLRTMLDDSATAAALIERDMIARENLARLAEELAAAETIEDVSNAITTFGPEVFQSNFATLGIIHPLRRQLAVRGPLLDVGGFNATHSNFPLDADIPIVEVARTGNAVVLRDAAEIRRRYPQILDVVDAVGLQSAAVLPLQHSSGIVLGAISVGFGSPSPFTPADLTLLRTVSLMCAQAVQRAQLGDLRRELVERLQTELLPPIPEIASLQIAARYIPANVGLGFGGDWYDIIQVDDTHTVVVVGDVAGHGIEAAARMAQVRTVVTMLIRLHPDDLDHVFVQAEELLAHLHDGYIATVGVFAIDHLHDRITYVLAGHPSAVLLAPDGTTALLDAGRRPLLGSGRLHISEVGRTTFAAGATLVAFTDGLVERRDRSTDEGIIQLLSTLEASGPAEPDRVANELLDQMLHDRSSNDDVALVVCRRPLPQ